MLFNAQRLFKNRLQKNITIIFDTTTTSHQSTGWTLAIGLMQVNWLWMKTMDILMGVIGTGPINNFCFPMASLLVVYKVDAIDVSEIEQC